MREASMREASTREASTREASTREGALQDWLRAHGSVLVGFSGGVDSAYLATVAVETLGRERVLAVIGRSASYPSSQWATARAVADRFAVPVLEVDTDEMNDPRYAANPVNRCYFCKSELWSRLVPIAAERGLAVVIDGTNADDTTDYRPGAVAARELAVASPLAEAGLTKAHIRLLSQRRGIPTWSQPASPCLSSRLPYGTAVTPARLAKVERAEASLRDLGVAGDLRVRYHDDVARVEIGIEVLQQWLEFESTVQIAVAVRDAGFPRVAIDLRGFRSGSLNVLGGVSSPSGQEAHGQQQRAVASVDEPSSPEDRALELQHALAARGLHAHVEVRGALAILVGVSAAAPIDSVARRHVVRAAQAAGFSHVALEVGGFLDMARLGFPGRDTARHATLPGVSPA